MSSEGLTLTGETTGPIVDGHRKADLVQVLSQSINICKEQVYPRFYYFLSNQVIAVGDGANDLMMLAVSGLGIAFNAKPKVQEAAQCRINRPSLMNVLYFLGFCDSDINHFLSVA